MIIIILCAFFLCWGSFLNVVAYRLAHDRPFFRSRSCCPQCGTVIAWYDNVPVISWLLLRGKCRTCATPISWLYPLIEVSTALILTNLTLHCVPELARYALVPTLFDIAHSGLLSYFIFFSALIICVRTDLDIMMIPQLFTLWLIPLGVMLSLAGFTQISCLLSITGAAAGYGIMWGINWTFHRMTSKQGIGQGDMELLALVGSFMGPWGAWISLLVGSTMGCVIGGAYLWLMKESAETRLPFGPFIVLGTIVYFFYQHILVTVLL